MRPICDRILHHHQCVHVSGLRSRTDVGRPMVWRPRQWNKRADKLCNIALDEVRSFEHWEHEIKDQIGDNSKFFIHSDGACRGVGYSSFAWTIHLSLVDVCDEPNQFQQPMCSHKGAIIIGYGATLVVGNYSSFMTELWGIEATMISFNSLHRQLLGDQHLNSQTPSLHW